MDLVTENQKPKQNNQFEVAKLLAASGDFIKAREILELLVEAKLQSKQFGEFLEIQNLLLRVYGELEEHSSINAIKERLQDLVIQEGFQLNSKTYYTLGVCATYKGQHSTAKEYFEKALKLGLETDTKRDICYAIYGIATNYRVNGQYEEALKEFYNLQVFFQLIDLPELELAALIMNGNILRKMGKYDQAIEIYWQAYDKVRDSKNLYMYIQILYAMGYTYLLAGETGMGKMYLNLAKRTTDPENHKWILRKIDSVLEKYANINENEFDLVLDSENNQLLEKKKGKVDFKSQFILMDLLRLFMGHPGEVFSKEALVENVWKQEYDPAVHDNKVYVTIKRLRKLIEPDYDKPKYIFRSKHGYFLNKSAKVMVHH